MSFKLNLKLATAFGKETAWRRSNGWMEEVPTLILGISMACGRTLLSWYYANAALNDTSPLHFNFSTGNSFWTGFAYDCSGYCVARQYWIKSQTGTLCTKEKFFNCGENNYWDSKGTGKHFCLSIIYIYIQPLTFFCKYGSRLEYCGLGAMGDKHQNAW